ncbi:MAG: GNAT family N-acetyltransferase [Planctomycetes bacterium]|nr:GNAT family N-acetyltransferase [Planctomycetota bacterium]
MNRHAFKYFDAPQRTATREFVIRAYKPGDGAALTAAVDASYEHLKRFMHWAKPHQPLEESEKRVREFAGNFVACSEFTLGVWTPDEKRIIGGTGYHLRDGPLPLMNAEIGMWIAGDLAGQGLGTRVLRELLRWGFTDWPWLRLSWWCHGSNAASRRVAEKAGMKLEGVLREHRHDVNGARQDSCVYAMLKSEWK